MEHRERKTALVTGASRGIGKGIAIALAKKGYDLAITYSQHSDEADAVSKEIKQLYGTECMVCQASLEDANVPAELIKKTTDYFQGLDLLVNNAGVTIFEDILDLKHSTINKLFSLDFKAYLLLIHETASYMVRKKIRGSIVNITSSRGQRAYPGDAIYGGIKAAIERAAQSIALDLSPYGIRVNCVAPGCTMIREENDFYRSLAPKIPLERIGSIEDIGNAVSWLASEEASYVTGVTLRVDGGLILAGMPEFEPKDKIDRGWGFVPKRQL
jgi:NAD(P)-dependent dehydrogenase (short-subunit alcohol dehydrogenase family)